MKKYITIHGFTFEVLNNKTKRAQNLLNNFNYSVNKYGLRYLKDCYERASAYKENAYNKIVNFAHDVGGYYTITGYNCMAFSMCVYVAKEKALYYFTAYNQYLIKE